jgi:hypothetical protein
MPKIRPNGGVIGPTNTANASVASGVYSVVEAQLDKQAGAFPQWAGLSEPYFYSNAILLHGDGSNGANNNTFLDSSTNALSITRNGTATQGTFSPFSQTGWSNYFNGTSDYLTTSAVSNLNFGSNAFTIEFWMWSTAGTLAPIIHQATYNSTGWSIWRYDNVSNATTTKLTFMLNGATFTLATAGGFTENAWNHIAVTKSGTTATIYINGVSQATSSSAPSSVTASTSPFQIWYIDGSSWNFTGYMSAGYISNIRILNGTALYTGNFTPPTAPLTAITNTVFLYSQSNRFIDNSSSPITLTTTGTPSVQSFSPFPPAAAYGVSSVGGSMYFNGSTDYLTLADSSNWAFGTGNFTIECWFYTSSATVTYGKRLVNHYVYQGGLDYGWLLSVQKTSTFNLSFQGFTSGTKYTNLDSNTAITANQWNHIAVSRSGSVISLFLNGSRVSTQSGFSWNDSNSIPAGLGIGAQPDTPASTYADGYVSNVRVVKGTAVYDPTLTSFTPPTSPVTAIANTQLLLNGTNAGIYDQTAKNDLVTVGSAQISTTQAKFGGSSMYFNGTTDYVRSFNTTTANFGTGDFTIEFWIYTNAHKNYNIHFDCRGTVASTTGFCIGSDSAGHFYMYANGFLITTGNTYSTGTWYHFALVKSGSGSNNTKIYINGVADGTATVSNNFTDSICVFGVSYPDITNWLSGYLDDIRITKGYARYTSNFTPATSAFLNQ